MATPIPGYDLRDVIELTSEAAASKAVAPLAVDLASIKSDVAVVKQTTSLLSQNFKAHEADDSRRFDQVHARLSSKAPDSFLTWMVENWHKIAIGLGVLGEAVHWATEPGAHHLGAFLR